MTEPHNVSIHGLVVSTLLLLLAWCSLAEARAGDAPLRGKAGLYVRLDAGVKDDEKRLYLGSPLVDAVVLMVRWRSVEPKKGEFHFEVPAEGSRRMGPGRQGSSPLPQALRPNF